MGLFLTLKGVVSPQNRGFHSRFCPYGGAYLCANDHPNDYPTDHPTPFFKRNVHKFAPYHAPVLTLSEQPAANPVKQPI